MSRVRRPPWGIFPLLSATVFLSVLGCSKEPSDTRAQAPDASVSSSVGSSEPVPAHSSGSPSDGGLVLRGLSARKGLEFLPFKDGRLLELIGERDETNRYASTVLVEGDAPLRPEGCSGILIHPRLVLTAGHCACDWRKEHLTRDGGLKVIDGSGCAKHAQVTAILHEPAEESPKPTIISQSQEGAVRIHPEFELHLDARGEVLTSHADLAVILLEEPMNLDVPKVQLAATEAQVGEPLVTAGFGNERGLARIHGVRYFKEGKITQVLPASGGRVLYEPAGPYFNTSYRGGPCFHENDKGRWVAGIVGLGTDQQMSFTSTYFHRNWLRAELEHAAAASSVAPQAP